MKPSAKRAQTASYSHNKPPRRIARTRNDWLARLGPMAGSCSLAGSARVFQRHWFFFLFLYFALTPESSSFTLDMFLSLFCFQLGTLCADLNDFYPPSTLCCFIFITSRARVIHSKNSAIDGKGQSSSMRETPSQRGKKKQKKENQTQGMSQCVVGCPQLLLYVIF